MLLRRTRLCRVAPSRPARSPGLGRLAALAALTLALSACERGCLSRRLEDRSLTPTTGGEGPRGSARQDAGPTFDLAGTDCSDGLARCTAGRVEVSIAGHIPHPCSTPNAPIPQAEKAGSCECPWRVVASCDSGCVKDGLEVVATSEVAIAQLCASTEPLLRPLLPSESTSVSICADEGVSCVEGVVRVCAQRGQPVQLAAACAHGCAAGISVDQEDVGTGDGRAAILCQRAHAERR
jgi:hypothetical protein